MGLHEQPAVAALLQDGGEPTGQGQLLALDPHLDRCPTGHPGHRAGLRHHQQLIVNRQGLRLGKVALKLRPELPRPDTPLVYTSADANHIIIGATTASAPSKSRRL